MSARVTVQPHLFDWFREEVDRARLRTGARLSDDTGLYLAQMLTEHARADRRSPAETTLAELHGRAANAPPAEQARAYRELGDRALTAVGLFRESLSRKTVGPSYYEDMGSSAYTRADQVFKRWFGDAFGDVFAELGRRFGEGVELLADIRERQEKRRVDLMDLAAKAALQEEPDPRVAALLIGRAASS